MKATDRSPRSWRQFALVLAGLLVFPLALWAQAPPAKVLVSDVIPIGANNQPLHVSTDRIMNHIKTKPGEEFNQATLDDDIRRLYETKLFLNVSAEPRFDSSGRVVVYFRLTELPSSVQEINFEGAHHINKEELETLSGLHKGMPLNPIQNEAARQTILRRYQEDGYMFAAVQLTRGDKPGDTTVEFKITEGYAVRVASIDFTGVEFVPAGRLRTQINSSRAFLHVIGGKYNPGMVDADVAKIIEYYRGYGFHEVQVSREVQLSEDQRSVNIIFHVKEGRRYRVGLVQLEGAKTVGTERLMSYTNLQTGKWYDENIVKVDVKNVEDAIGVDGVKAAVHKELVYKDNGEVDVHYQVQEMQPAYVGQVIIHGNTVTKDRVILRQMRIFPGQVLSYPDINLSQEALGRLNIFEVNQENGTRPTIEVLDPDGPNPFKDVLVNVEETRTGSLMFGVGVNSDAGLTGSIVLNERNFDITRWPTSFDDFTTGRAFRGGGQEFRAEAVPGTTLQRYTVSWREPYFLDSAWSVGVSGYYYTRDYNEYNERREGMRFTVGRRLDQHWQISEALRIEGVNVSNVVPWAPPDYLDVVGGHFQAGFRTDLTYDSRNSFLRPTAGSKFNIGFEEVTGDYTFPLFSAEANHFWTVYQRADGSGRHVIAAHSEVSIAGSNTPVYERYFAGGYNSLRGFEFRGVGPDVNGFMVGGDFMFLNSVEYQVPILANDQLYGVVFLDSGTVESRVSLDNYRVSTGFGIRIVVPMLGPVPIALDFGFPLVKASTDKTQVFSFWLGFFH
jgi:outer membrane protein assembly complex protein YaeT